MTVEEAKQKVKEYRDFFGGTVLYTDKIEEAQSMEDISIILDMHEDHIEMMCRDAVSHLDNFRRRINVPYVSSSK